MEFTKEDIQNNWKILNTSVSPEEKKKADEFLIKFKVKTSLFI
jgi:hypothetical protein